ncbi:uncharacterized protein LOC106091776 isoform X2 [Stomoxys calcitrans]|nr:uncharacterized protein LOC106091776 isoform X2 [Stomoxys calcitrans]XP_059227019.1 uncharacterized protein LOC106091776 isoform X2 [Stomoxys calcitrans]
MSPAEETSYVSGPSKKASYTLVALKFLELCLIICCIGLIDEPATQFNIRTFITPRVMALCYVTFGSLLIYSAIYLIMALFGDVAPWRTSVLWSLVAFILFIATTSVLFRDWSSIKDLNYWHPNMTRLDLVLSAAAVSLVTTLIYLMDILITIRFGMMGDLE